jgi:RND family efflux transporter MFP subunit
VLFGIAGVFLAAGLGVLVYVRAGESNLPGDEPVQTDLRFLENVVASAPKPEDFVGIILSRESEDVKSTLTGRVLEVHVNIGAEVKAGDPLVTLDAKTVVSDMQVARSEVSKAEMAVAQAKVEVSDAGRRYAAAKKLAEAGAGSQADVDDARGQVAGARAKLDVARSGVVQAKERLKQAETVGADAVVRSPFDGRVASVLVGPASQLVPGTPVARVVNPEKLFFRFAAEINRADGVAPGKDLVVKVENSDIVFHGKLTDVSAAIDQDLQALVCEGTLDIPEPLRARPWINQPVRVSIAKVTQGQ